MLGPFALFCGVVVLAGWVFLIRDWLISASWASVPGVVRGVELVSDTRTVLARPWEQEDGFRPVIRYAYQVEEQTYVGERFSATRGPFFATQDDGDAFLQRFPLHSRIPVKVDPKNPRQALLQRQLSTADALPGYLGLACLFLGIIGW